MKAISCRMLLSVWLIYLVYYPEIKLTTVRRLDFKNILRISDKSTLVRKPPMSAPKRSQEYNIENFF